MAQDPFLSYGLEGARTLLTIARRSSDPEKVLRDTLESVQSGLWSTALTKQARYKAKGYPAPEAQRLALAATLANHLSTEVVNRGLQDGYEDMGGFFGSIWGGIKGAASALDPRKVVSAAGSALKDLACKAAGSSLFGIAAGTAAAAAGAPPQVGIAGAGILSNACAGPAPAYVPLPPPSPAQNPYLIPALIGGGVLLVALVLRD